jgi:NAD-dependent dihydropyrimidine dehydrogenase PreA subunit
MIAQRKVALSSLHQQHQHQIIASASHMSYESPPPFGAQFVEVAVDTEMGQVTVERVLMVVDAGRVINPITASGQVEGGLAQAISFAHYEEMAYDEGWRPSLCKQMSLQAPLGPSPSPRFRWMASLRLWPTLFMMLPASGSANYPIRRSGYGERCARPKSANLSITAMHPMREEDDPPGKGAGSSRADHRGGYLGRGRRGASDRSGEVPVGAGPSNDCVHRGTMAKGLVIIDEDRCKGCGLCVSVCPKRVLQLAEGRFNAKGYRPVEVIAPEACTGCARCAVICPDVVFTVYQQRRKPRWASAAA